LWDFLYPALNTFMNINVTEKLKTQIHFPPSFTDVEREWLMKNLREMVKADIAYLFNMIMDSRKP
jgi:hypothetical protein